MTAISELENLDVFVDTDVSSQGDWIKNCVFVSLW
jgi:hypothetical protein